MLLQSFIVLAVIALTISIGIGAYFAYYKYMKRNKENVSGYDYVYHAKIINHIKWKK